MSTESSNPDLGVAVALRLRNMSDSAIRSVLVAAARARSPSASNLISRSQTAAVRRYSCNVCGAGVDTESARYAMTKHASEACAAHLAEHIRLLGPREIGAARSWLHSQIETIYRVGRQPKRGRAMAALAQSCITLADLLSDGAALDWAAAADAYYEAQLREPERRRLEIEAVFLTRADVVVSTRAPDQVVGWNAAAEDAGYCCTVHGQHGSIRVVEVDGMPMLVQRARPPETLYDIDRRWAVPVLAERIAEYRALKPRFF